MPGESDSINFAKKSAAVLAVLITGYLVIAVISTLSSIAFALLVGSAVVFGGPILAKRAYEHYQQGEGRDFSCEEVACAAGMDLCSGLRTITTAANNLISSVETRLTSCNTSPYEPPSPSQYQYAYIASPTY